jgi:transcriptional regulator with XRE-family HTH domain
VVTWNEFGERFHILRRRKKLTLKEIASQAGTSYVTVSLLERGKKPQISLDVVVRLAEVLNVSLDYLVGRKATESVEG